MLFQVRRQRFLELLSSRLRGDALNATLNATAAIDASAMGGGGATSSPVLAVVAALREVEAVCESRAAFNSLCYCLTLPSVNDHPDFSDWTPHLGRLRAFRAVRAELLKIFPEAADDVATNKRAVPPGQLEHLLSQAAAAQTISRLLADPRIISVRIFSRRDFHMRRALLSVYLTPRVLPVTPAAPTRRSALRPSARGCEWRDASRRRVCCSERAIELGCREQAQ